MKIVSHIAVAAALLIVGVAIVSTTGVSNAAKSPIPGAHFKNGESAACTFGSTTVVCDGTIVGLGGQNVDIFLDAPFTSTVTCSNPQNQDNPSRRTTTGVASGQTTVQNASNNLEFDVDAVLPNATGSCRNNWIMTSSSAFTGQWTITVCVSGEVVLFAKSSGGAPSPSCG